LIKIGGAMVSQEQREQFIELRAEGLSFDAIAAKLNVSKSTLIKMSRELAGDIERLKFINLEALAERYKILKAERLEGIGKILGKVDTALENVDLSKVSAEKLIELKLKLTDKMLSEISQPYTIEQGLFTKMREKDSVEDFTMNIE